MSMYWYRHLLPPISLYCTVQYNINTLCQYTVSGILPYEWLLCVVLVELSCVIHGWRGKWMWVIILCSSHNVWFIHHLLCVGFKSVYVVFKYHVTFVSIFQQFPGCVGQFVEHRILDPKAISSSLVTFIDCTLLMRTMIIQFTFVSLLFGHSLSLLDI